MKPRLLDLFCCQGGAAMGYSRAGFEVAGVDLNPQPRYPFEFHQGDALAFLAEHWREFDAYHASPPCQDHSQLQNATPKDNGTGWLLAATIAALRRTGRPWVVENVPGPSAREAMPGALTLCGSEFGLGAMCHDGEVAAASPAPPVPVRPLHRRRGRVLPPQPLPRRLRRGVRREQRQRPARGVPGHHAGTGRGDGH